MLSRFCRSVLTSNKLIVTFALILKVSYSSSQKMDLDQAISLSKRIAPSLDESKHKGQAGRIGVFGGSLEYTGAPYFAAISALRVGADLSHVFCAKEAAPVIKSYSPELIVHPLLDSVDAAKKIEPWLERLHVILIGPGLGREPSTFQVIDDVIRMCKARRKPLVIDADGLFYLTQNLNVLKDYPAPVILTPNAMEFMRLIKVNKIEEGSNKQNLSKSILELSTYITILCKGHVDEIFNAETHIKVVGGGSGRRCGGQGDLLSGSISTFLSWALENLEQPANASIDNRPIIAAYSAAVLTRACNQQAFLKYGRSMIVTDMILEIHSVFDKLFEVK